MKYNTSPLGDVIELVIDHRGITPKKLGGDWSDYGYVALSAKNIKTGKIVQKETIRFVSPQMYKRWMPEEVERNDIFVTSEAPFGEIYLWDSDEKIVLSQRIFGLRVKKTFDPVYLFYYMCTNAFQGELSARASGTTVTGLRQPELLKCLIRYPNLSNQKRIGNILRSIDKKIQTNSEINDNLSVYSSIESTSISPDINLGNNESRRFANFSFSRPFLKIISNDAVHNLLNCSNSFSGGIETSSFSKKPVRSKFFIPVVPFSYMKNRSLSYRYCHRVYKNKDQPVLGLTALQKFVQTRPLSKRFRSDSEIYATLPVDCVGLPPEISTTK